MILWYNVVYHAGTASQHCKTITILKYNLVSLSQLWIAWPRPIAFRHAVGATQAKWLMIQKCSMILKYSAVYNERRM